MNLSWTPLFKCQITYLPALAQQPNNPQHTVLGVRNKYKVGGDLSRFITRTYQTRTMEMPQLHNAILLSLELFKSTLVGTNLTFDLLFYVLQNRTSPDRRRRTFHTVSALACCLLLILTLTRLLCSRSGWALQNLRSLAISSFCLDTSLATSVLCLCVTLTMNLTMSDRRIEVGLPFTSVSYGCATRILTDCVDRSSHPLAGLYCLCSPDNSIGDKMETGSSSSKSKSRRRNGGD